MNAPRNHGLSDNHVGAEYTDEEREFIVSVERWQRKNHVRYPSFCDILAVAKSRGYRKVQTERWQKMDWKKLALELALDMLKRVWERLQNRKAIAKSADVVEEQAAEIEQVEKDMADLKAQIAACE